MRPGRPTISSIISSRELPLTSLRPSLSCFLSGSACFFRSDKAHKGLSASHSEKDNFVFLGHSAFHTRRPHGHPWNRQASGTRPLLQQFPQGWRGHMPLDDVAPNLGRMTGSKVLRYAKPFPYDFQVSDLLDSDGETCGLEMSHPACAASAIRILVYENACTLADGRRRRHDQCRRRQSKYASSRQSARTTDRWTIHGLGSPIFATTFWFNDGPL